MHTVVTAIQGLIDAADEQLMKREISVDLSKVSHMLAFVHRCIVFEEVDQKKLSTRITTVI